jgi:hypothetical protein
MQVGQPVSFGLDRAPHLLRDPLVWIHVEQDGPVSRISL